MRWWIQYLLIATVAAPGISGSPIEPQQNDHLLKPEQTQRPDSHISTPSPEELNQAVSTERPIQGRRGFHKGPLFESFLSGFRGSNLNLTQPGTLLENLKPGFSPLLSNSTAAEVQEDIITAVIPQQRNEQAATVAARILDSDSGNLPHVVNSSSLPLRSTIRAIAEHADVRVSLGLLDYEDKPAVATNKNQLTITKMVDVSNIFLGTTTLPSGGKDSSKNSKEKTNLSPSNKFNNPNSTVRKNHISANFSENLIDDGYSDFFLEAEYFSPETQSHNFDLKDSDFPKITMYRMVIPTILPCKEECQFRMAETGECKKDYACLLKRSSG